MNINKQEIEHALHTFFSGEDVFEIRVLNAVTNRMPRPHIESGYFDVKHIGTVAECLSHIESALGVYFTANPVKPLLLNRRANRIDVASRGESACDTDILERRWLLIDCDAVREGNVKGIPSSNAEHEKALVKAIDIREHLCGLGFALPIYTDSGNGAQLMFRISLPNNGNDIVKRTIDGIAKQFTDEYVDVDKTVYNPARIWRLPGTWNCKGDSTGYRPHRECRMLYVPDTINVTGTEKLESVATHEEPKPLYENTVYTKCSNFNLDTWIAEHVPEISSSKTPWKDGWKWTFRICPFNHDHDNSSAVITQLSNGAIAFKCHHNGCSGKAWKDLRELYEPGYSETKHSEILHSEVNIDALIALAKGNKIEYETKKENGEIIDEPIDYDTLFNASDNEAPWNKVTESDVRTALSGTLLGKLVDIYSVPVRPQLPLAASLSKALVTFGSVLSGEADMDTINMRFGGDMGFLNVKGVQRAKVLINTGGGMACNVYALIVGESASGKDIGGLLDKFADMNNPSARKIKDENGNYIPGDYNLGNIGSAEGIAEAIYYKPNGVLNINEFQPFIDSNKWQSHAASFLTSIFNKGVLKYALSSRGGKSKGVDLAYAFPNVIANVQPDILSNSITQDNIDNGFLCRFLICTMPDGYNGLPRIFNMFDTIREIEAVKAILERKCCTVEVPYDYMEDFTEIFSKHADKSMHALWRRLINEYYPKIATFMSIKLGDTSTDIKITQEDWDMAKILVCWFMKCAEQVMGSITTKLRKKIGKDKSDSLTVLYKVMYKVSQRKKNGIITLRDINCGNVNYNGVRIKAAERRECLNELIDMGFIEALKDNSFKLIKSANVPKEWKI